MEENKVDTSVTGSGQPSVDSQPVDAEKVQAPFEGDDVNGQVSEQSNDETPDKNMLPQPDETQVGVQDVHYVDEDPEQHVGAETADPWNNEKETDWVQPSDKSSE